MCLLFLIEKENTLLSQICYFLRLRGLYFKRPVLVVFFNNTKESVKKVLKSQIALSYFSVNSLIYIIHSHYI